MSSLMTAELLGRCACVFLLTRLTSVRKRSNYQPERFGKLTFRVLGGPSLSEEGLGLETLIFQNISCW